MGRISRLLYPETAVDAVITISLFLTLGIWLVFQRYKTIRDRAVLFYWPAPPVRVIPQLRVRLFLNDSHEFFSLSLVGSGPRFQIKVHRKPFARCSHL